MSLHFRTSKQPPTKIDRIVGPLCGGGIPLLCGIVMVPIGIRQLARGDPHMQSFGWSFTLIGALLAIIGAVVVVMLWPERKPPADDDGG